MNLADALRSVSPGAAFLAAVDPLSEERREDREALEPAIPEGAAAPEPPQVPVGNVVRLELWLSGEQMQGMLRAIMAGQHTVLTAREAASYLRITPASLLDLAEKGEVPGLFLDGKWRFPKCTLDEWMVDGASCRLPSAREDEEHVA
jgi:excisionase family DNA binding protein